MTKSKTKPMTFEQFLGQCSCCGGNWVLMLWTGIERAFPQVAERHKDEAYVEMDGLNKLMDIIFNECGVVKDKA